jgi:hypothetical protein
MNEQFIDEVIGAIPVLTAGEERALFEEILREVHGDSIQRETLSNIYERLETFKESYPLISSRSLKTILVDISPDKTDEYNTVFEEKIDGSYDFLVDNLIPDFKSKSLCIINKDLDLSIAPETLTEFEFVEENGRKFLQIPIKETLVLNGFNLTE